MSTPFVVRELRGIIKKNLTQKPSTALKVFPYLSKSIRNSIIVTRPYIAEVESASGGLSALSAALKTGWGSRQIRPLGAPEDSQETFTSPRRAFGELRFPPGKRQHSSARLPD